MRAIRAITAIALVANIAAGQHLSDGDDQVDELVSREMAAQKIPGVAVAVIERGKTLKKA